MKKLLFLITIFLSFQLHAQKTELLPVRGLCMNAPGADRIDLFVQFINDELAPRKINVLVLRVGYNYQYKSHPELANENGLSLADVKKLVAACREHNIRLIPSIDLLGHQSWASSLGKLLTVYPEFDETPHIQLPEKYEWPNKDGLYCKSYCPLHPEVHQVIFDVVDEICDAFESDAFHAGMDEVFYIGDDDCPRCSGHDKSVLFADEVRRIRDHLKTTNREMWLWGDRLIDGKTTGIGMWEASMNNTHRAIDLIPKDVTICDWHYDQAQKTAVYFAMKGLNVITCPWKKVEPALQQKEDVSNFRASSSPEMKERFRGIMHTVWSGTNFFIDHFYDENNDPKESEQACFKALFPKK